MRQLILATLLASSLLACSTPNNPNNPTPPPVDTQPTPDNPDPNNPDTTAPVISIMQPESNDAAINSSLLLTFSEAMNSGSVRVSLEPNIALSAGEWKSEEAVEFKPNSDLAPDTTYKVNVTGKDLAGNTLSGSSTYQFKTSAVKDTTPPGTPQDVNASAEPEQVKLSWKANTEPDLSGYVVRYGTNSLNNQVFVSKPNSSVTVQKLKANVAYSFVVIAQDRARNQSKASSAVNATPTGASPVKLVSSVPANKSENVSVELNKLSVTFSAPMQQNSVKLGCSLLFAGEIYPCGTDGSGTFESPTWSDNDRSLTWTRRGNPLIGDAEYRLEFSGAKDKTGNTVPTSKIVFRTVNNRPVVLVSSTPKNGASNVGTGQAVSFTFDRPLKRESFKPVCAPPNADCTAKLTYALGVGVWSNNDKTVTYALGAPLEQQTQYVLLFEGQDKNGIPISKNDVFSFTTATAPVVVKYVPPANARGIPDGAYIYMTFSKKMNLDSLKQWFSGEVSARDGSTSRKLVISRVEEAPSTPGTFAYNFVPSEKYGDGTLVTWVLHSNAADTDGSRLPQIVADSFRVMQRLTTTIPIDANMTGYIKRQCLIICLNRLDTDGFLISAGFSSLDDSTFVKRAFIGFNLDGVLPETAQISKATLTLPQSSQTGQPFLEEHLGTLALQRMDYGPKLDSGDFDLTSLECPAVCRFNFRGPPDPVDGPIDVTAYLQADWAERSTRGYHSQYRLRFANNKPAKGNSDHYIQYKPQLITLTIEYQIP